MTDTELVGYRTCPLCEAMCGLEINRRGGEWLVRGDRDDPFSQGFICPKGTTLGALHDDPDRLDGPVIREGDDPATATWRSVGGPGYPHQQSAATQAHYKNAQSHESKQNF